MTITASQHIIATSPRGRELTGETRLRREERERYTVGSTVAVWYSGIRTRGELARRLRPRPEPSWPATAVPLACGVSALVLIQLMRRQSNLLRLRTARTSHGHEGREEKIRQGDGWMVHYEWTTLSGATRRGKYQTQHEAGAWRGRPDSDRLRPRQHVPAQQVPDVVRLYSSSSPRSAFHPQAARRLHRENRKESPAETS